MSLDQDRKTILEKYGPYVRSIAATVRKQFHTSLEIEDLVAYGQIGLLEAADRFNSKLGANFLTFAHYRIKGSIFDGLRKMGILKGTDVKTVYSEDRVNAYLSNVADRDSANGARNSEDDVRELTQAISGLAVVIGLSMQEEALPADQRLEVEQLKAQIREAMEKLPEKEKRLIQEYYFQSKTLEDAGAEIGQSKSWASRLHARAIERLKDLLSEASDEESQASRRSTNGSHGRRSYAGSSGSATEASGSHLAAAQAGNIKV